MKATCRKRFRLETVKSIKKRKWQSVHYCKNMNSESLSSTIFIKKTKAYEFYHGKRITRFLNGQKTVVNDRIIDNQYIPLIRIIAPLVSSINNTVVWAMVRNNFVDSLEVTD